MRRHALALFAFALAAGAAIRPLVTAPSPARPLDCASVAGVDSQIGARLVCQDDPVYKGRPVEPGWLMHDGLPVGLVPGAILASRGLPIDLSRAGPTDLRSLPNIGPGLARRIIEARSSAPICSLEDLSSVKGLGPKRVRALDGRVAFLDSKCPLKPAP